MKTTVLIALTALVLNALPALAEESHDRARAAVLAGEILPLSAILKSVEAEFPGDLLETELEEHHGRPVYEIKVLTRDGRMIKARYDARTGERLKMKGRP